MPRYGPREARPRLIDDYADYLRGCVEAHPRLSGRHLHREIAELGYKGGYTAVTDFLRGIRPVDEHRFELRFETPRVVWLFSMVLRCHLAAFEAFRGCDGQGALRPHEDHRHRRRPGRRAGVQPGARRPAAPPRRGAPAPAGRVSANVRLPKSAKVKVPSSAVPATRCSSSTNATPSTATGQVTSQSPTGYRPLSAVP